MRDDLRNVVTVFLLTLFLCQSHTNAQDTGTASLEKRIEELAGANKYAEAALLAEQYAESIKIQQGELDPQYIIALNRLIELYKSAGQDKKSEQMYALLLGVKKRTFGAVHPEVARTLNQLALFHRDRTKYDDAELALNQSIAIFERTPNENTQEFVLALDILTGVYRKQAKFDNADIFSRRALAIRTAAYGADHPKTAIGLAKRALLQRDRGRYGEGETLLRRALRTFDAAGWHDRLEIVEALNVLAGLYRLQRRFVDAEPLLRRVLNIVRDNRGSADPETIDATRNLALLYRDFRHYSEAEKLLNEVLNRQEKSPDTSKTDLVETLNVLGGLYRLQGRFTLAESTFRRALTTAEQNRGTKHSDTATAMVNLARNYVDLRSYSQAEPLLAQALAIQESWPGNPGMVETLDVLSLLYEPQGRFREAERHLKRALSIRSEFLGADHADVADNLSRLGRAYYNLSEIDRALESYENAVQILMRRRGSVVLSSSDSGAKQSTSEASSKEVFEWYVRIAWAASEQNSGKAPELRERAYEVAQLVQPSVAAAALSAMSARFAGGESSLSTLVREHQDLSIELRVREDNLREIFSQPPQHRKAHELDFLHHRISVIEGRLQSISSELQEKFPKFAELSQLGFSSIEETRQLLEGNEALIQLLIVNGEGFVWAITKEASPRWVRINIGAEALAGEVQALRCGLDVAAWEGLNCPDLTNQYYTADDQTNGEPLPFDHVRAFKLYQTLFGQLEDLIKGKDLLLVPSGALMQLPFQVLETAPPAGNGDNKEAAWFIRDHALTVLPAVSSLKALRRVARPSAATKPIIGFGNPLLNGPDSEYAERAKLSRENKACPAVSMPQVASAEASAVQRVPMRGEFADLSKLREQPPLPETAYELCAVARDLSAEAGSIYLGERATEREVKALSADGRLAQYRIVHFATHGALAGDIRGVDEPGLILTPPNEPSQEDDGYLTASEIATLKLDADWVILSACNTAAGGSRGDTLSGLARAFLYAQARALLVSHWAVNSDAAVKIITGITKRLAANKSIGRAEAARQSMVALIENGTPREAQPAFWAPFVVVGEGAAGI